MAFLSALLLVLFVIVCLLLIVAILLQPGKGEGLGALGGMSTQVFGGGGAVTFLSKVTTVLAIAYMVLVILLAKLQQPSAEVEIPQLSQPEAATQAQPATESQAESTAPATEAGSENAETSGEPTTNP